MTRFTIGRRLAMAAAGALLLCGPALAQDAQQGQQPQQGQQAQPSQQQGQQAPEAQPSQQQGQQPPQAQPSQEGQQAGAENFPDGPIEVVIHTTFGGGTDTTARMMAIGTGEQLGTDMVVVSKPGGGGAEAQNYVMSKPADGQTVLALTQTHLYTIARGGSQMKIEDVQGVARAMDEPNFLVVSGNSEYQTIDDLVEASKQQPLNWGISVIGSTEHIGLARLAEAAGIQYKVVPFGSGGEMVQALLSGAIDAIVPNVSEAAGQIEDGSMRALLVMREERLDDYPDVPTSFEKNWPVKVSTTRGYAVRAGTPQPVVEKLSQAMVEGMKNETFAKYLETAGLTPEDNVAGWQEWDKQLKEEYQTARDAMEELGLLQK